jgi:titin
MSGATSPITVSGLTNGKAYTCRVSGTNAIGTGPASAPSKSFIVGARPGAPVNVRAVPGPATNATGPLKVSFKAGSHSSPITSYRARCRSLNGGVAGSRTRTSSPITVTGLTTGKTYLCTVTETTGSGTSLDSSPARATVGAPAPPAVLRHLPLDHGLAFPLTPPANNGSAITQYQSRCSTGTGPVRTSPPQPRSPLIAPNLTNGQSYICAVTARNARGLSPQTMSGPATVGRPSGPAARAACSGTAGGVAVKPGLAPSPAKPQTFALASTLSKCTGPYVRAASLSISFRSSSAVTCTSVLNVNNTGSGTIRWTAPRGMGKSALTLRFVITSTSGHTSTAHVYGQVTSTLNVFTGSHVSGDVTLDRGLKAASSGGDCSGTALTHLGITAIKLRFS